MTVEQGKELMEKLRKLETDKERLQLVAEYKDDLKIVLDNDSSMVEFKDDELGEAVDEFFEFDDYFGNAYGILSLFELLGIEADRC